MRFFVFAFSRFSLCSMRQLFPCVFLCCFHDVQTCAPSRSTLTWFSLAQGDFVDGKISGSGKIMFANGNVYVGEMLNDKRHGRGVFTWADGEKYEGKLKFSFFIHSFVRSFVHSFARSLRFELGHFENDMRHGQGTYHYENGERYEGEFSCGMKHGQGVFYFNSKLGRGSFDVYTGEFKKGLRCGKGEVKFANGNVYIGEFANDKRNGHGVFIWVSGNRYEGQFRDDKRTGHGTYIWTSGGRYAGDFDGDCRSGTGEYFYPDGSRYEGSFKNGVFDGIGCYHNRNGWTFEGEFNCYKRNGIGLSIAPDGKRKFRETWQEGHLVDREELFNDPLACMIYSRFRLKQKLGSGSYGEIYMCEDKETKTQYAIKLEKADRKKLRMEIELLQAMVGCEFVSKLHFWGHNCNHEYMVMDYLGENLNDLRKNRPQTKFSIITSCAIGIQMVKSIQALHDAGFVHRDIKPSNFVMGRGENSSKCYIIDFGLARRYMLTGGSIIPPRKKAGWNGTQRYASINTHQRKELGRHDDLWSLLYVLVQFMRGHLPWCKTRGKDAIGQMKVKYHNAKLVKGLPPEMLKFMEHLKKLGYYDRPDYNLLVDLLDKMYKRETASRKTPVLFEWQPGYVEDAE
jgi:predicted Ser/Thr protein kinase